LPAIGRIEGETGINIAAGVEQIELTAAN